MNVSLASSADRWQLCCPCDTQHGCQLLLTHAAVFYGILSTQQHY